MKVSEVILTIKNTLKLNDGEAGLFVSVGQLWLDPDSILGSYKGIRFLVHIYESFSFIYYIYRNMLNIDQKK